VSDDDTAIVAGPLYGSALGLFLSLAAPLL